ncbi:hypothetical protein Efla_001915 [Eimeria flavescens]
MSVCGRPPSGLRGCGNRQVACQGAKGPSRASLRAAAVALCVGIVLAGCWTWRQVFAGFPPLAIDSAAADINAVHTSGLFTGYGVHESEGAAPRRLGGLAEITAGGGDGQPYEKSLADLKQWRDILGVIIIGVACVAAVSAGTGGGSIYVPVMTLVMDFSPHTSTVMSQALMCGGVLAGTLLNLCQRHPFADRPLVDLDLCLPAWLLVTALVVVLSVAVVQTAKQYKRIKRERLVAVKPASPAASAAEALEGNAEFAAEERGSFSLDPHSQAASPTASCSPQRAGSPAHLSCSMEKSISKAMQLQTEGEAVEPCSHPRFSICSKDSQVLPSTADDSFRDGVPSGGVGFEGCGSEDDLEAGRSRLTVVLPLGVKRPEITQPPVAADEEEAANHQLSGVCARNRQSRLRRARRRLREMQHRHNILKWFVVVAIWLVDIALGIIRGEKNSYFHVVPYCGLSYWLIYCVSAVVLMGCSYLQGFSLLRLQRRKDEAAIIPVPGDLHFDLTTLHLFFLQTILAGLVAGMVGIGSSLVVGPIMLMNGMLPVVCTAVNTALVLCSSSSAAVKSAFATDTPWDYCLFLFCFCFVCAMIGKFVVDRLAQKYDADHVVVLFLIVIMCGSMTGMVAAGIIGFVHNVRQTFKSPCG